MQGVGDVRLSQQGDLANPVKGLNSRSEGQALQEFGGPYVGKCLSNTKAGTQCRSKAAPDSQRGYCSVHERAARTKE